jgi:hypothetical protein
LPALAFAFANPLFATTLHVAYLHRYHILIGNGIALRLRTMNSTFINKKCIGLCVVYGLRIIQLHQGAEVVL